MSGTENQDREAIIRVRGLRNQFGPQVVDRKSVV